MVILFIDTTIIVVVRISCWNGQNHLNDVLSRNQSNIMIQISNCEWCLMYPYINKIMAWYFILWWWEKATLEQLCLLYDELLIFRVNFRYDRN
jgi:hypothetical protein